MSAIVAKFVAVHIFMADTVIFLPNRYNICCWAYNLLLTIIYGSFMAVNSTSLGIVQEEELRMTDEFWKAFVDAAARTVSGKTWKCSSARSPKPL